LLFSVGSATNSQSKGGQFSLQPEPQYSAESQSAIVSSGTTARPQTTSSKKESRPRKSLQKTVRAENTPDDAVRQHKTPVSGDGSVTRPDRDSPVVGGKSGHRDDFTVDIRVAPRRTKNDDILQFNEDFKALSANDSGWKDSNSAARFNAEELLQVSCSKLYCHLCSLFLISSFL
jgi:hypothetical protein